MALKLDILANTRQFVSEAKKAGASVEDISDELDDMAREAKDSGDKVERTFRDLARESRDTGRDIGKNMDAGFKKAGEGAEDFKQEANSTAREAAASFDGSAESIGDAFQEVAANAFAGFGPAGAIAGLGIAAGIGLGVAALESFNEQQELSQQNIADWADAFVESGGRVLTAGVQAAKATAILTDPERFKEAENNAKTWGVAIETAIAAMSGNTGAINEVEGSVRALSDAYDEAAQNQPAVDAFGNVNGALLQQETAARNAQSSLGKLTGEMEAGASRAQILNKYYEDLINSTSGATREVDELGNELYTLPDETQVFVDAKTGQASQNVAGFKGDLDGIPDKVTTRIVIDDSAIRNYRPPTVYIPGRIRASGQVYWTD